MHNSYGEKAARLHQTNRPENSPVAALRWLETVSSTFQDVAFDGSLLPLFIS